MKKQRKIFVTGIMVAAILFGTIIEHGEIKKIRNYGYANRHEKI